MLAPHDARRWQSPPVAVRGGRVGMHPRLLRRALRVLEGHPRTTCALAGQPAAGDALRVGGVPSAGPALLPAHAHAGQRRSGCLSPGSQTQPLEAPGTPLATALRRTGLQTCTSKHKQVQGGCFRVEARVQAEASMYSKPLSRHHSMYPRRCSSRATRAPSPG